MPPKSKAAPKPKEAEKRTSTPTTTAPSSTSTTPSTVNDRTKQRIEATNPLLATVTAAGGLAKLSPVEKRVYLNDRFAQSPALRARLGTKAHRDLWKHVNEASQPICTLPPLRPKQNVWGVDKTGRDVGTYSPADFNARTDKRARLTCLSVASRAFEERREQTRRGAKDPVTGEAVMVCLNEVDEEKDRRKEMDSLRRELYGQKTGTYAQDPEWDGAVPIELGEQEGELAAIAYPEDYAEAISYLRASMLRKEYSPRTLRLTEHIIGLNPAHYTVWLYRASILSALQVSVPEEITWLNQIALANLKNYQIWHHRHLLVNNYYASTLSISPELLESFAASETEFLTSILSKDTKNYHVWSYRSFLVRKLGLWRADNNRELRALEALINDDVRNNSAWSHRFFIVFSDPENSIPDTAATSPDPAIPSSIIDREVSYAQEKIHLGPQNPSPWNYLRGVLVKGGRRMTTVEGFVREFVEFVGDTDREKVVSSHALEMLAEICVEKGDPNKAKVCLRGLAETWDPVRAGYWGWKGEMIEGRA